MAHAGRPGRRGLTKPAVAQEAFVKALVVAPAWVGDMVMAHTLVPGLAARGAETHFLAPTVTAPLAERMPGVAAVHRIASRHGRLDWRERRAMANRLRRCGFDQAIVLPSSLKSALTPWLADIPRRTGFRGEARFGLVNDMRKLDERRLPRLVDRFAALADAAPAPPRLRSHPASRRRVLQRLGLNSTRPAVALCPGAEYGGAKRWPVEHFATLATLCVNAGAAVWVLGGQAERAAAEAISARAPSIDLTGRTTLAEAVDLLAAASAAVANDSGLMHVAAALDVPVAALYGSTSPRFTPPLATRAVVVTRPGAPLACSPCFKRECPLGHLACMNDITPSQVFQALQRLGALHGADVRG